MTETSGRRNAAPRAGLAPRAFSSAQAFRAWLETHHATSADLVVRCYKNGSRGRGMTYLEALDEALCFGWIDGVRRSLDDASFSVRFSPRKPRSKWSLVNTQRARALFAAGRMRSPGLAAFDARDPQDARLYSFEARRAASLAPAFAARLRANRRAWTFFEEQAPWYRRTAAFWVMSAKLAETRERRFAILLACSAKGRTIPPLTRPEPRGTARRRTTARGRS